MTERLRVGQRAFIMWPGDFYDVHEGVYDFKRIKDFKILEVFVCSTSTCITRSKLTGREYIKQQVSFISKEQRESCVDRPLLNDDWDKPFIWKYPLAKTIRELFEIYYLEYRKLEEGVACISEKLDSIVREEFPDDDQNPSDCLKNTIGS